MKGTVQLTSAIERSPRVQQIEGMFDVTQAAAAAKALPYELELDGERPWNLGLICGPSGCGKSSIARHLFGEHMAGSFEWDASRSILDGFPKGMGIRDISMCLSSVGFSSPPAWLRPFHVLSNGEQFRVAMARVLAEQQDVAVVDEFTSVVDRQVARVGSAAIAKAVRRSGKRLIAVTCHDDVEEWLQPDWVFLPAENRFTWRSVQRRPALRLTVNRTTHHAWKLFQRHHYLTSDINKAAFCFVAFLDGTPVAFDAWLPFFGRLKGPRKARRGHRTVVLPDFQGVGIGRHLFDHNASMWAGLGFRCFSGTGHPAEIASRRRYGKWRMTKAPGFTARGSHGIDRTRAVDRLRASFEWIGPQMAQETAAACLECWAQKP